ncbi:helix-turn-helix domain-containing protein [Allofournierella sp.]|uniref:helix-turn-helix domain-containing protein n=1 Tax=Allofournierella sp. TaxID=1940256 RepID=UPI002E7A00BE|nr:helix-turn-helix transcriptional regulator [Fournierella sp.]MEE0757473.1 helix-turn-helix transcriptional regulator [Fournierella sp.]
MDAKTLGDFIAGRRRELGLTQAQLAARLHLTDKAVSRWERGVGLPDLATLEPLAAALEVNLAELMTARRQPRPLPEAEEAAAQTLALARQSRSAGQRALWWACAACLGLFGAVAVFLVWVLAVSGPVAAASVASLLLGLGAWSVPLVQLARRRCTPAGCIFSLGLALAALAAQFADILTQVRERDWSALMDTMDTLVAVVVFFCAVTLALNLLAAAMGQKRK